MPEKSPRFPALSAAGFTTAFGAHGIAANLGSAVPAGHSSLLVIGALLAIYDGAEVILKPVFGTLADRIGPRPVLIGGLIVFACASILFVVAGSHGTSMLWIARAGQGAGAAAFSPAASFMIAKLNPAAKRGKAFGSYGFYKSLGYTAGPVIGGGIVALAGVTSLFGVMAIMAVGVALWARLTIPLVAPVPRRRQTLLDTITRLTERPFLRSTAALAAATAALSTGVGFLPISGAAAHLGSVVTGALVSVLALTAAVVQPWAGRALDAKRLGATTGMIAGLSITAVGFALAATASCVGVAAIVLTALAIGIGTGIITPIAFTTLAQSAPEEHLGQTIGAAEIGRESGDALGPLIVGAAAAFATLGTGYLLLAIIIAVTGVGIALTKSGVQS